ncbi:TMEM165/GDT1 family protein [Parerythrobacter aestuarii]|uniref:TMEM165/GDT1 family protein n=1 Tax=Parerythrobacter aestuarii TaxID=3020909 RepID=UPI0024DED129|nr:TMEM165/GDT1 family protein [Parerythrobacter aestuarii]
MSSFLFGFALVLLVSIGARDQLLVARMDGRTGPGILVAGCIAAIASASLMAWAGDRIAHMLFPAAREMLVALALLAAVVELLWPNRSKAPKEPTHSIFAAFLVLLARQIGDAGRFLVFALAAVTALPSLVATGGALGGIAALTLGWIMGTQLEEALPLRAIRLVLAMVLAGVALFFGLTARGMI